MRRRKRRRICHCEAQKLAAARLVCLPVEMLVCARNPSVAGSDTARRVDNIVKNDRSNCVFCEEKQCAFVATWEKMDCTCLIRTNVSSSND